MWLCSAYELTAPSCNLVFAGVCGSIYSLQQNPTASTAPKIIFGNLICSQNLNWSSYKCPAAHCTQKQQGHRRPRHFKPLCIEPWNAWSHSDFYNSCTRRRPEMSMSKQTLDHHSALWPDSFVFIFRHTLELLAGDPTTCHILQHTRQFSVSAWISSIHV